MKRTLLLFLAGFAGLSACGVNRLKISGTSETAPLPATQTTGAQGASLVVLSGTDPTSKAFSFRMGARLTCGVAEDALAQGASASGKQGRVLREWLVSSSENGPFTLAARSPSNTYAVGLRNAHDFVKCRIVLESVGADGVSAFVPLFESSAVEIEDTPPALKAFASTRTLARGEKATLVLESSSLVTDADGDLLSRVKIVDWPLATPAPQFSCDASGRCISEWTAPSDAPASISARYVVYTFGNAASDPVEFSLSVAANTPTPTPTAVPSAAPSKTLTVTGTCLASATQDALWTCALTADGDAPASTTWALASDHSCAFLSLSAASGASVTLSGTPGSPHVGTCVAKVVATHGADPSLTSTHSTNVGVTASTSGDDLPVIAQACPTSVNEDAAYACSPSASNPDAGTLTWSKDASSTCAWATVSGTGTTGTVGGTPTNAHVGSCTVVLKVNDSSGNNDVTQTVNVTVDNVAHPFALSDQTIAEDGVYTALDADIQASDEGQGSGFYEFHHAGISTGTRCDTVGSFSTLDTTTGAFTFTPGANWNGVCRIRVRYNDGNGGVNPSTFDLTVSAVNDAPPAPSAVAVTPTTADEGSTLTCTPTSGGADPEGDVVGYVYAWYNGVTLLSGATGATLTGSDFARGDGISCRALASDGTLASALVASNVVTIQNATPSQPATVTLSSATPTKSGSFSCGYTAATDADGDTLTYAYVWKVDGTVVSGQSASTLSGAHADVVKAKVVTCEVSAHDGTASGSARASTGVTVLNATPTGTVSCDSGSAHIALKAGAPYGSFACSGASDPDSGDSLSYSLAASTGSNCPSIGANGTIAAATPASAGTCTYSVRACDQDAACTAASADYMISVFTVASAFQSTPSLDTQCRVNWTTANTLSSNLAAPTYAGGSNLSGASVSATDTLWRLTFSTPGQPVAGQASATYGLTTAEVDGVSKSGIFPSASASTFTVSETSSTTPSSLALERRAHDDTVTLQGTGGRELPRTSTVCHTCTAPEGYGQISAGHFTSCALTAAGGVMCWGRHNDEGGGAVGNGLSGGSYSTPRQVTGFTSGVKAVSTATRHACAIVNNGTTDDVRCWGANTEGQLGVATSTAQYLSPAAAVTLPDGTIPVQVETSAHSHHQSANAGVSCAVLAPDGKVGCWGANTYGHFGNGSTSTTATPTVTLVKKDATNDLTGVKQLTLGRKHACAVVAEGADSVPYCWGQNDSAQLATPTATTQLLYATKVTSYTDVVQVAAGVGCGTCTSNEATHTCAVRSNGKAYCWGNDSRKQLGTTAVGTNVDTPVEVANLTDVVQVSVGQFHSCALTAQGAVWCWGDANGWFGNHGQLGDTNGTVADSDVPVQVKLGEPTVGGTKDDTTALSNVVAIDAGSHHTCALLANGNVKCWGETDGKGSLGINSTGSSKVPMFVVDPAATTSPFTARVRSCSKWDVATP